MSFPIHTAPSPYTPHNLNCLLSQQVVLGLPPCIYTVLVRCLRLDEAASGDPAECLVLGPDLTQDEGASSDAPGGYALITHLSHGTCSIKSWDLCFHFLKFMPDTSPDPKLYFRSILLRIAAVRALARYSKQNCDVLSILTLA